MLKRPVKMVKIEVDAAAIINTTAFAMDWCRANSTSPRSEEFRIDIRNLRNALSLSIPTEPFLDLRDSEGIPLSFYR